MCFRPAEADVAGPAKCPNCGKMVFPVDGILPKKCPFCRKEYDTVAPAQAVSGAPTAPGAPKVPTAPGAPKAPTA